MEIEATTWSEFPNRGKAIVEKILVSEEINKSKRVMDRDPSRKVNYLRKVFWNDRFHQVYQFHENRLASLYDGC